MFYGEFDFTTEYNNEYKPKRIKKPYRMQELDVSNNCMNNVLKTDDHLVLKPEQIKKTADGYCKPEGVQYEEAVGEIKKKEPTIGKKYFEDPLDKDYIEYRIEFKPKSIYQVDFCKRGFCYSRNIVDKIDFGVKLDETHPLPDTSTQDAHRDPASIALRGIEPTKSLRPVVDNTLKKKTEEILGTTCGETTYEMSHSMLGRAILEYQPYGEPRNAPECNRWGHPVYGGYIYNIRQ